MLHSGCLPLGAAQTDTFSCPAPHACLGWRPDWYILSRPVAVTSDQVLQFMSWEGRTITLRANARPVQPLNGRQLQYDCLGVESG